MVSRRVLFGNRSSTRMFVAPHTHLDFDMIWSLMPKIDGKNFRGLNTWQYELHKNIDYESHNLDSITPK